MYLVVIKFNCCDAYDLNSASDIKYFTYAYLLYTVNSLNNGLLKNGQPLHSNNFSWNETFTVQFQ